MPLTNNMWGGIMKIAVVAENNKVSQHFGQAKGIFVYDTNGKKEYFESPGHGEIPALLKSLNIDFVACGGIGQGAMDNLIKNDIKAFTGLEGFCDDIAEGFFRDILVTGRQKCCGGGHDHKHHGHHGHHGENHSCNCKCGK